MEDWETSASVELSGDRLATTAAMLIWLSKKSLYSMGHIKLHSPTVVVLEGTT